MADKPTKAELAKLPGGAEFDVASATSEEFDKHFEILARQAKLDSLKPTEQAAPTAATKAPFVAPGPNPGDIKAMKNGQPRYFSPTTWDLLGDDKAGWELTVERPA